MNVSLLQVLHYLAMQKPADLTCHLLPCVLHAALLKLKEEGESLKDGYEFIGVLWFHKYGFGW